MSDATPSASPRPYAGRLEIVSLILLALATLGSAWCANQAARWGGVQATNFSRANAARVESSKAFSFAVAAISYDAGMAVQYVVAQSVGRREFESFYEDRVFRQEARPYIDSWLASQLEPATTAPNFLDNPEYIEAMLRPTRDLEEQASENFSAALQANANSDHYILNTVFLAMALFFAGIAGKFNTLPATLGSLSIATLLLIVNAFRLAELPIA